MTSPAAPNRSASRSTKIAGDLACDRRPAIAAVHERRVSHIVRDLRARGKDRDLLDEVGRTEVLATSRANQQIAKLTRKTPGGESANADGG
jgi:hypothetical protein